MAQPGYRPMLHNERKWQIMVADASVCNYIAGHELKLYGDTVINGLHYFQSSNRTIFSSIQVAFCPPYYLDSVATPANRFFREDTTARKVYQLIPPFAEETIYDFSLQVGDTFFFWNSAGYDIINNISYYHLSATDSTRVFHFIGGAYWTEGYDCSEGAFEVPVISVSGSYYRTYCIIDSGTVAPNCASGFAGLNNHEPLPWGILQNTIADDHTLFIKPDFQSEEDLRFEVWDLLGQLHNLSSIKKNQTEIQLPQLNSGIYITRFYFRNGDSRVYKILIP